MLKKNLSMIILGTSLALGCSSLEKKYAKHGAPFYNDYGNAFLAYHDAEKGRFLVDINQNHIWDAIELAEYVWTKGKETVLDGKEAREIEKTIVLNRDFHILIYDPVFDREVFNYWRPSFLTKVVVSKSEKDYYNIETSLKVLDRPKFFSVLNLDNHLKGNIEGPIEGTFQDEKITNPDLLQRQWTQSIIRFMTSLPIR